MREALRVGQVLRRRRQIGRSATLPGLAVAALAALDRSARRRASSAESRRRPRYFLASVLPDASLSASSGLCILRPSTMVTTRSQDKMTFADKIRAKGFSLADCKFFKLNALFPIMLALAHATVALWCGSGLAAAVVGAIPVADEKVVARCEKINNRTSPELVSRPPGALIIKAQSMHRSRSSRSCSFRFTPSSSRSSR